MFRLSRIQRPHTVLFQLQALQVRFHSAIRAWSHSSLRLHNRLVQDRTNSQGKKLSSRSLNSSWFLKDAKLHTGAPMLCFKVKVIRSFPVLIWLSMVSLTVKQLMESSPSQQTRKTTSMIHLLQVSMRWPSLAQLKDLVHSRRRLQLSYWLWQILVTLPSLLMVQIS